MFPNFFGVISSKLSFFVFRLHFQGFDFQKAQIVGAYLKTNKKRYRKYPLRPSKPALWAAIRSPELSAFRTAPNNYFSTVRT
jgi:hypothetical protein